MKNSSTLHNTIFGAMCRAVGSDYANDIEKQYREGGLNAISAYRPNPSAYSTPHSFRDDYLIYSYLSKFELSQDKEKLEKEAVVQFKETESRMLSVNRHLRTGSASRGVEGIISDARRKISSILGYGRPLCDSFNMNEFAERVDWGPGATATLVSEVSTLDKKILEPQLSVTRRAIRYALAYLCYDTNFVSARLGFQAERATLLPSEFNVIEYDRFTTVPKSWKSRRAIAIQPTMNLFLQKSVGSMIRKRLLRCGIDLDDQSRNQNLACRAYFEHYATIDLAKASDSVSTELVRLLLPDDWFQVMNDLRTHQTKIDDEVLTLNKFSAMGNGFTFELESLIFYALSWAVVRDESDDRESEIAVYGDDIIVSSKHALRLIDVLSYCGFETNVDKTFVSGPFYESCGKHFFQGADVSPIFQKKMLKGLPELMRGHNRLFRWCSVAGVIDNRFDHILSMLYACSVREHRIYFSQQFHFRQRKRAKKKLLTEQMIDSAFPRIPFWLEGDDGILTNDIFATDVNRKLTLKVLSFRPFKVKADNYALFATAIRKGVVVSSPYLGLLSKRGVGKFHYCERVVYRYNNGVLLK